MINLYLFVWKFICMTFGLCIYKNSFLNNFNSKTAYRNVNLTEYENGSNALRTCQLIHINTVFRHGTRFPSAKHIMNMEKVFKKINESSSRNSLPNDFLNWKMPFSTNKDKELTEVGIQEMMELGERFREQFNSILNKSEMKKHIKVFSTSRSRCKLSAQKFLYMFLNKSATFEEINKMIIEDDGRLRYFDNCPYYTHKVEKNEKMKKEYFKFLTGPEMTSLVNKINKYSGLKDNLLTADDVSVLYTACGFEIATNLSSYMKNGLETSPLCSFFDKEDFAILEYLFDLKHYWIKSYGDPITKIMSCKLMSDILQQIMDALNVHKSSSKSPESSFLSNHQFSKAIFWFSHAETILPLVALLGLFNQKIPMTSESFKNRLHIINNPEYRFSVFRSANIVPFSANLGIYLYHCPNLSPDGNNRYRIQIKVNEKAVPWPQTNGLAHVSISEFRKILQLCHSSSFNFSDQCKFNK